MKEIIERHTKIIEDMLALQKKMLDIMHLIGNPPMIVKSGSITNIDPDFGVPVELEDLGEL